MKSGYDDFFKAARDGKKAAKAKPKPKPKKRVAQKRRQPSRSRTRKKSAQPSYLHILLMVFGLGLSLWMVMEPWRIGEVLDSIDVSIMSKAGAQDKKAEENKDTSKDEKSAKDAGDKSKEKNQNGPQGKVLSDEEYSYFSKLNERKRTLDDREKELDELEAELHKQKVEIETRIKHLQKVRRQIASILKERVEVDQQKVNKLVAFYSNMKPQQAAEIIGDINEDLAIEVLGKMKKKNAAAILNLIKPDKAKVLSEKFAGYKKR